MHSAPGMAALSRKTGICSATLRRRWLRGDRGDKLIRAPDSEPRAKTKPRDESKWRNSLLVGWKLVDGVLEAHAATSQSASTEQLMVGGTKVGTEKTISAQI